MDASKKAQFEKTAVMALAGVFLVVFLMGPARSLGLFGSRKADPSVPAQEVSTVAVPKSVGGMLQDGWEKMGEQLESASRPEEAAQAAAPNYTAFDQRDPFKSLLPKSAAELAADQSAEQLEAPVEAPKPPPELRIDGLLWGGPEPKAIINGRLYRVDDQVDGAKIVHIGRDGVTVDYLGKPIVYSSGAAR